MFTGLNLTDMETCYKAMTRIVADRLDLQSRRFGIEPEITSKVARLGVPDLRGADFLRWPHLFGREEDRTQGRVSGGLDDPQIFALGGAENDDGAMTLRRMARRLRRSRPRM